MLTLPYPDHLVSGSLGQILLPGPLLESDLEFRVIREQRKGQAACSQLSQDSSTFMTCVPQTTGRQHLPLCPLWVNRQTWNT